MPQPGSLEYPTEVVQNFSYTTKQAGHRFWNVTLPSEEIILDTIVTPDNLFSQNKAVISGNPSPAIPERWDLELQRGIYTLTITSGSSTRILTFNATTGALIS